jgi:hypothetical protein
VRKLAGHRTEEIGTRAVLLRAPGPTGLFPGSIAVVVAAASIVRSRTQTASWSSHIDGKDLVKLFLPGFCRDRMTSSDIIRVCREPSQSDPGLHPFNHTRYL